VLKVLLVGSKTEDSKGLGENGEIHTRYVAAVSSRLPH
jgi:hypothetical protein